MSGMKEIKMAEQSFVQFMSLDRSIGEDVDACRWLFTRHTGSDSNMCFFSTYNESASYLLAKADNIVSHSFIHIVWYHWRTFKWSLCKWCDICCCCFFPTFPTDSRPYLWPASSCPLEPSMITAFSVNLVCSSVYLNNFMNKFYLLGKEHVRRFSDYFTAFYFYCQIMHEEKVSMVSLKSTKDEMKLDIHL